MNTKSRNVYRFTVPSQPDTRMRYCFTPLAAGEVTIEISAGPPPNISSPSPPTLIANPPPQYSTAVCSTPHVLTDTNASPTSSEEHPSNTEMVTLVFDAIPSQKLIDLAEHEFGSDEEVVVTLGQKQLDELKDQLTKKRKAKEDSSRASPSKLKKV